MSNDIWIDDPGQFIDQYVRTYSGGMAQEYRYEDAGKDEMFLQNYPLAALAQHLEILWFFKHRSYEYIRGHLATFQASKRFVEAILRF